MTSQSPPQLTLWGIGTSRTMRPHWALAELGLPYKTQAVESRSTSTQTAEFAQMHPGQKVPVLQDREESFFESTAIVLYLADRYGDGNLLPPTGTVERGQVYQWCFYAMTELDAHTLYVNHKHRGGLSPIYGKSAVASDVATAGFAKQIQVAGKRLADGRDYLLGEQFTVADIVLGTCLLFAKKQPNVEELRVPEHLWLYLERLATRPAYQIGLAVNRQGV